MVDCLRITCREKQKIITQKAGLCQMDEHTRPRTNQSGYEALLQNQVCVTLSLQALSLTGFGPSKLQYSEHEKDHSAD